MAGFNLRTLERVSYVVGWPLVGVGVSHAVAPGSGFSYAVCALIGLILGLRMPSLLPDEDS